MFERELRRFRSLVRERRYILTIHALEEMSEDDVLNEDIEHAILTGKTWSGKSTAQPKSESTYSPDRTLLANLWESS